MSRRFFSSCEDRRKLNQINNLFSLVMVQQITQSNNDTSDSDAYSSADSDDSETDNEDNDNNFLAVATGLALTAIQQQHRTMNILEDEGIEFQQNKTIDDYSDSDCQMYFRFLKCDLQATAIMLWPRLSPYLNSVNPANIEVGNRYVTHYETCLCAYLFKLSHASRLRCDAERFFGMRKSKLSQMILFFGRALFQLAVKYLSDPSIWHERMPYYATKIEEKCGGMFANMWGFIDATIRRTCRPTYFQETMYTSYKKCHGLKFQSIVTPDGYIACLAGPYVARRHDVRILRESNVIEVLQELMPLDLANGPIYYLYGDLAYEQSVYLFGGYRNAVPGTPQALFNRTMSKCRIVVEWGFANVLRRWQYLDQTRGIRCFKQPVAQMYINGVFLTNIGNCFYGGAINQHFDCETLSLQQYLSLID